MKIALRLTFSAALLLASQLVARADDFPTPSIAEHSDGSPKDASPGNASASVNADNVKSPVVEAVRSTKPGSSTDDVALTTFLNACDVGPTCDTLGCDHPGGCGRDCVRVGDTPHSILIPGSTVSLKLGGYAKADFIRDFDAIGNTDKFDTTTIPTDGTRQQNWRLHARQTRLNLDARGPSRFGEARGFVEIDFFSDQNSLRLRHAYAEAGPLLGGQTWTTFMDTSILPVILDYENPIGMIFDRRALLRWTRDVRSVDGLEYALAIEDPVPVFTSTAGIYESELPDLVGRLRYEHNRFHAQLAGFASRANFTPTVGQVSDDNAWGFSLTGTLKVFRDDFMGFQFSRGDGIEGFRGFQRYDLNPAGEIEAVPSTLWMTTYHHFWSECLQTTLVYARADVTSVSLATDSLTATDYASVNLIWRADDRIQMGLEYLHGSRVDFDNSTGSANRLQFAIWYFLP